MTGRQVKELHKGSLWTRVKFAVVSELRRNWSLFLIISVPMAFLIVFSYAPIYGVQIAFRDYTPVRSFLGSPFVGMKYFQRFFANPKFWQIMWNTLSLSLYSLATFPLSICFALLINYNPSSKFRKTVQQISYAPYFLSTVVMASLILQFLDLRSGMLNNIITLFGGKPINFISYPENFAHIYVWSGVWQGLGYSSIIYISALSGVPTELHEAAIMDGASILKRIWHIDIPCLLPTISILLILSAGGLLGVGYEKVYLLQNSMNATTSEVISTYVYKQGILATGIPQYSYATAVGLFISLINAAVLLASNAIVAKLNGNSLF